MICELIVEHLELNDETLTEKTKGREIAACELYSEIIESIRIKKERNDAAITRAESYSISTPGTLLDAVRTRHRMEELQRAIEDAQLVKTAEEFNAYLSRIVIRYPKQIAIEVKRPDKRFPRECTYTWIDSIGSLKYWEKLYLWLRLKGKVCRSASKARSYKLVRKTGRRMKLIKEFDYRLLTIEERCATALVLSLYPVVLAEEYESIFLPLVQELSCSFERCLHFVNSNALQYDSLLTDSLDKAGVFITQLQHGLGYNDLEGDVRLDQEVIIASRFLGWAEYPGMFPVLRKTRTSRRGSSVVLVYPSLNKYPGRDLISRAIEERSFYDESVKLLTDLYVDCGIPSFLRIRRGECLHKPSWQELTYIEKDWETFENILENNSKFICIGISTTIIQCLLNRKMILWILHSKAADRMRGSLRCAFEEYASRGLVLTEKLGRKEFMSRAARLAGETKTVDVEVDYGTFDIRVLASYACDTIKELGFEA